MAHSSESHGTHDLNIALQDARRAEMEQALKPCPFCGNDGSGPIEDALQIHHNEPDYVHDHRHTWMVQCDKCTATMGYSDSEEEAIEAWNKRPTAIEASPVVGEIEVVEDAIKRLWPGEFGPKNLQELVTYVEEERKCDAEYRASLQSENQALREARAAWEETRFANAHLNNEVGALRAQVQSLTLKLEELMKDKE